MVGRLEYNSIKMDFARPWSEYAVLPKNYQTVQSSLSGLTEVLAHYNQHTIKVSRTYLTGSELDQLMAWYEYVRDGSSFKFWRDKDLVLYAPLEKNLINRVDGTSGVFTRSGTATYLDRSTGEIETVATDNPRYPAGAFGDGLEIHNATSNILNATETFSNATYWTPTNCTATANQMIAPDGALTADKIVVSSDGANLAQTTATAISTNSGTFSVWVRTVSATQAFDLSIGSSSAGQLATAAHTATTEWQRFTVSHNSTGSVAGNWYVKVHLDNAGEVLYLWGAQLEIYKHATGYVADAGTRVVEAVYWTLPSFFDYRNWSISLWVKVPWNTAEGTDRRFINLADGTSSNCYWAMTTSNSLRFVYTHYNGAGSFDTTCPSPIGIVTDEWQHLVLTFNSNIDNEIYFYLNGVNIHQPGNVYQGVPKITNRLYIGAATNQTAYCDGTFDDVLVINGKLSAGEVKAIYNSGRALGVERSYFAAVRLIDPTFNPVKKIGLDRWDFNAEFEEVLS